MGLEALNIRQTNSLRVLHRMVNSSKAKLDIAYKASGCSKEYFKKNNMPTVIALKDINTVYGPKKEGEAFQASPRQARIMEEAGDVQIINEAKEKPEPENDND